jgi:cellobiose-specific phosphotransferase system component IIA
MTDITQDKARAMLKALERALETMHDIDVKLYVMDAKDGPIAAANRSIEEAIRSGYVAHTNLAELIQSRA